MIAEAGIKARYEALRPWLDERARRLLAAAESQAIGPRGISAEVLQLFGAGRITWSRVARPLDFRPVQRAPT
jgi:hypothetical protein